MPRPAFLPPPVQRCAGIHVHSTFTTRIFAVASLIAQQHADQFSAEAADSVLLYCRKERALRRFGGVWAELKSGECVLRSPKSWARYALQYLLKRYACNCALDNTVTWEATVPHCEFCERTGTFVLRCHKRSANPDDHCGLNATIFFYTRHPERDIRSVPNRDQLPDGAHLIPFTPRKGKNLAPPAFDQEDFNLAVFFGFEDPQPDAPVAGGSKRKLEAVSRSPPPAGKRGKPASVGAGEEKDQPIDLTLSPDPSEDRGTDAEPPSDRMHELAQDLCDRTVGLDVDQLAQLKKIVERIEACDKCHMSFTAEVIKEHNKLPHGEV